MTENLTDENYNEAYEMHKKQFMKLIEDCIDDLDLPKTPLTMQRLAKLMYAAYKQDIADLKAVRH